MKSRFGKTRLLCLFILSLFLMEYLEPSAVGVRADFDPPLNQGKAEPKSSKNLEDSNASTPHAMLSAGDFMPANRLIVRSYLIDPTLQPRQRTTPTIYRPPVPAR